MSNIILPTPVTRKEHYKHYQVAGGDIADLPQPVTRDDCYEYAKCVNGVVVGGTTVPSGIPDGAISLPGSQVKGTKPYVKATLNSGAGNTNYFSALFDLSKRSITANDKVCVRFRFKTLTAEANKMIGVKLFTSANDNQASISGDKVSTEYTDVTALVLDKEYLLEGTYVTTDIIASGVKFLKPFIAIGKVNANSLTNVEVYDVRVIIYGQNGEFEEFDITNTVKDFSGGASSNVQIDYMDGFRPYMDMVLNSDSKDVNYVSSVSDLGKTILKKNPSQTTAKAIFQFKIKGDSAEIPTKVSARLFADNVAEQEKISTAGYMVNADIVTNPVSDKVYYAEIDFPNTSGNFNLHDYDYLKPYLVFQKTNNNDANRALTHSVEIQQIGIKINGLFITDITKTAGDFAGKDKASKNYIETNPTPQTSGSKVGGSVIYYVQPKLKYEGKICTVIGDSNVWGLDADNTSGKVKTPWADGLKDYCKFSKVNNLGIPSTTLSNNPSVANWQTQRNPVVTRWNTGSYAIPNDSDVIIFAIGVNDLWLNVVPGAEGTTNVDTKTLNGALNVFLQGLIAKFPHAKIAGCTIVDYGKTATTYTVEQYNEVIRKGCASYGIPVIDFSKIAGFSCKVPAQQNLYMKDKLHYSQLGHTRLTQKAGDLINYQL